MCLQNFKSIKSRGAIQQQMMNKLVDTQEQFLREVIAAQEMFDRCKANPPLTRNQPPVAGGSSSGEALRLLMLPSCVLPGGMRLWHSAAARLAQGVFLGWLAGWYCCRCHQLEPPALQQGEAVNDQAECRGV